MSLLNIFWLNDNVNFNFIIIIIIQQGCIKSKMAVKIFIML